MKFCPNCGFPLNNKKKCDCGYDVVSGEVDDKIYEKYNKKIKENYERQCDILKFGMGINNMNETLINQQPIFNKEPDIIMGADYIEEMKQLDIDIKKIKKNMEESRKQD